MPNYENGKIYKICSGSTDQIYIGSTINSLFRGMREHRFEYITKRKKISSRELLKYEDAIIVLIENYPCCSKEELETRERYWIEFYESQCVNIVVPTRTLREKYALNINSYADKHQDCIKKDTNHQNSKHQDCIKTDTDYCVKIKCLYFE